MKIVWREIMVDRYCWLGPGANKPFDSIMSDWKNSKLTKRSICVLKYIKEHSPMNMNEYDDNIIQYLKDNGVGSDNLTKKHTYGHFLFVNLISKNEGKLEITESGLNFLNCIDTEKYEKATEIYLDQLFDANFETDATKDIEIRAFPVQIMFKLLYDIEIIPLFMFQTHIQFIKDIPEVSIDVHVDRFRFTQVITNFINNAVKFTKNGYIKLGYTYNEDEKQVYIYVEDTGIGMSEDALEKVFERFYKQNEFAQGTGLGLSICKTIAEQLKGDILVSSKEGKGSRFTLKIPGNRI